MSAKTLLNSETILDINEQPLQKNSARLLCSLNHLMTVGTYYAHDHEQYLLASRKTSNTIFECMGNHAAITMEICSEGLMIGDQIVEPNHREVRQLYELLVPLNIARLEIKRSLTPGHLRTALNLLHEHKIKLGTSNTFKEVRIDGLPPSIRIVGCRLSSGDQSESDPQNEPAANDDLAQQFTALVDQIISNLEMGPGPVHSPGNLDLDLQALLENLKELARVEKDPQHLLNLIQNARQALDLSKNPNSVDMVFRLLRNNMNNTHFKKTPCDSPHAPLATQSHEDLEPLRRSLAAVSKLAVDAGEPNISDFRDDYLGICFHVSATDHAKDSDTAQGTLLNSALSSSALESGELALCSRWTAHFLNQHPSSTSEHILSCVVTSLRESHLNFLPNFWLLLWKQLNENASACAWPYLVNDLLLGTGRTPAQINGHLLEAVASVSLTVARERQNLLFDLGAFSQPKAAATIFSISPDKLYPLHTIMLGSPLAEWHGTQLRHAILKREPDSLLGIVMRLLGKFQLEQSALIAGLLENLSRGSFADELKESIVLLLANSLVNLPRARRLENWVLPALSWLNRIDPASSQDVLAVIINEKRWFFFKAWPQECRQEAERMVQKWSGASAT